ncbi:hypothetical protein [Candidatus Symbiopectobacterium sp. NZEC135]|uniref:hypothetical protein n=1 Tax=Candidatus Symbiopectobacterium sp. NZEC135 TaxID=2820471 RepID=UPI002226214C|nr:hypothetical protein [Candidatus Symbiopectobacterium sp. NZEC135]MCW2478138.1 hypothetical protein [Candidatus Symbiopectobacterium sp. NZEC135]
MDKVNDLKENKYKYRLYSKAYTYWSNMHNRVRNSKAYSDVMICSEWYLLSNFYKWFEDNYTEGWEIDKDIHGSKLYSPETCVFVPHEVNQLFRNYNTNLMKGVVVNGKGFQSQITINGVTTKLGTYPTQEEANNQYLIAREQRLIELSQEYPELSSVLKKQ